MDKIVIILIGGGVLCVAIGFAMFVKLILSPKSLDDEKSKSKFDDEYEENFRDSFSNTGNIEDTLEELANIYDGNKYMMSLINGAISYIRDEDGDYETALEKINVDNDKDIEIMHKKAINNLLGKEGEEDKMAKTKRTFNKSVQQEFEEDYEEECETANCQRS